MPRIPTYRKVLAWEIKDSNVVLGEQIGSTGLTAIYNFAELKKYFGALGGTGVTSIIDKNDNKHTGDVKIFTGDISETTDFRFVTDIDLLTLDRFLIDQNEVLEVHDQNGVKVITIGEDAFTVFQSLYLKDVSVGNSTMESLVIDSLSGEIKRYKISSSSSSSQDGTVFTIIAPSHQFIKNDFITKIDLYWDDADNIKQLPSIVMVVEVVNANVLKVASTGKFDWSRSNLIEGADYYLAENGEASVIYQQENTQALFRALSVDTIYLNIGDMFSEIEVVVNEYAVKFKSNSNIDTQFSITYNGLDTPIWDDGTQQLTGTTVTFNWTDPSSKEVFIYVDDFDLITFDEWDNINIYELNLKRITSSIDQIDPFNTTLRRFYSPRASVVTVDFDISNLEILYLSEYSIQSGSIKLRNSYNLYEFVEPKIDWSVLSFVLTNSAIYENLNLGNLTIEDSLALDGNIFIEDILFNINADWSLLNSLTINDSSLLNYVDFIIMSGILTPANSSIAITNIGASESDVDNMLMSLDSSVADNSVSGRRINLSNNAPPSASGLIYKQSLESKGIIVMVD